MKVLAVLLVCVATARAAGSGPYLPSGWRPKGPAFLLPGEVESKSAPLEEAAEEPVEELSAQAAETNPSQEYGPPKGKSAGKSQDITLQKLPELSTQQPFADAGVQSKFNPDGPETATEAKEDTPVEEPKEGDNAAEETPKEVTEAPKDGSESPKDATEAPKDGSEAPKDDSEAPKDVTEAPKDNSEAPKDDSESPKNEPEAPKDNPEAPKDDSESPKDETEAPKDNPEAPKDDSESPKEETEAPKADAEAPKDEAEAPKPDAEAPKDETEAPKADLEAPKDVTEAPKSDAETPKDDAVNVETRANEVEPKDDATTSEAPKEEVTTTESEATSTPAAETTRVTEAKESEASTTEAQKQDLQVSDKFGEASSDDGTAEQKPDDEDDAVDVSEALKKLEEVINNQAGNPDAEIKPEEIFAKSAVPDDLPEGFLEYGPPNRGFREYGPPKEDSEKIQENETRRRRFSPKFRAAGNIF